MARHAWDFSPNPSDTKAKSVMNSFTGVSVCFQDYGGRGRARQTSMSSFLTEKDESFSWCGVM